MVSSLIRPQSKLSDVSSQPNKDKRPTATLNTSWISVLLKVYCDIRAHVEPAETAVAREWSCKRHVTADRCGDKGNATTYELWEDDFFVWCVHT
jgi:hypothetical protein